jgi:predicted O-linked N-acetylglucosamine transferase (SPINDLY family)
VALCRQALQLDPGNPAALNLLGFVTFLLGDLDEATAFLERAIQAEPARSDFYNDLGIVIQARGDLFGSISQYREAVRLDPNNAAAVTNLGSALQVAGQVEEAIPLLSEALRLQPSLAEAHNNLGNCLRDLGMVDEALAEYREALRLRPDYPQAHGNLGVISQERGDLPVAQACFQEALRLNPNFAEAQNELTHLTRRLCDWSELSALEEQTQVAVNTQPSVAVPPWIVLAGPSSPAEQLMSARNWVKNRLQHVERMRDTLDFRFTPRPKGGLRIGYLSADFREHATAYLIAELFELHDRSRFDVIAYSIGPTPSDPMRRRLERGADTFVDLGAVSYVDAARRIFGDRVDILVDLKGYTQGARVEILALRPAPVQVNFLGYPGTMGAGFIDYIITDRFLTPPDQQQYYSERFAYLPHSYQPNDRKRLIAEHTPTRAECGLPEHGFVYCCFNGSYKITPQIFGIWMRLLRDTPGSVLWLLESNGWAADNLRMEAATRDVDPQRLIFAPQQPLPDHLARHSLADLFLDTLPVNAHTTASDALWAGLPLLTCAGDTFASRVAGSLLNAVGLPELITQSLDEYEARALQLAHGEEELSSLRSKLAANRNVAALFDSERFTRNLELAYLNMWSALAGESGDAGSGPTLDRLERRRRFAEQVLSTRTGGGAAAAS